MLNKYPKAPIRRKSNEPLVKAELDELRMKYPGGFFLRNWGANRQQRRNRKNVRSSFVGQSPVEVIKRTVKRTFLQRVAGFIDKVKRGISRMFQRKGKS